LSGSKLRGLPLYQKVIVIFKELIRNKYIYLMLIPVVLYYIIFHYIPMYGVVIAFKNFNARKGILGSDWVGLKHFEAFIGNYYFPTLIRNTIFISLYGIIFGFPAPIIFALLLNEIENIKFKKLTQTITYMPHFLSLVVVCGMIVDFCSLGGVFNIIRELLGMEQVMFLMDPKYYRTIHVASGIWQNLGWNSIIYIAALAGIDPELYAAARIDGAGRWKQTIHVTLPSIMPTIVILLILRMGSIMSVGHEKIILLYNPITYETADVISTYVYRKGLLDSNYSYSSAVGLFNSVINYSLLLIVNAISKRVTEHGLW